MPSRKGNRMKAFSWGNTRVRIARAFFLAIISLQLLPVMSYGQNLGSQPASGQAVQGQTAAQPEGAVLNLVNWVGNVIAPVGAALAVVMAVIAYSFLYQSLTKPFDPSHAARPKCVKSDRESRWRQLRGSRAWGRAASCGRRV